MNHLYNALSIDADEGPRTLWMILFSMSNGLFQAFYIATANALFLDSFSVETLPSVYICSALLAALMMALFSKLEKKASFGNLLLINLGLLLALVSGGWLLYMALDNRWVSFFIFVGLTPSISLLALGFWGLAGRLFDLREAKRLFGLIGTGAVLASMFGFFTIPVLLRYIENPAHLLLFSAGGMAVSILVLAVIIRKFRGELQITRSDDEPKEADQRLAAYFKDRYFFLFACCSVLLVLAFYLIDLSFLNQVKQQYQGSEQLAQFMGIFFGSLKAMELLFKTFVAGRVLSHLGVRFALLSLPTVLLGFTTTACLFGFAFGAGHVLFYLMVSATKMIWIIVRQSVYDPSLRVLFQPLPAYQRLKYQTKMDIVGLGCALTVGVVLLLFSQVGFNALYIFLFLAGVYITWIVVIRQLHDRYRDKLMENLSTTLSSGQVLSPAEEIAEKIRSGPPEDLRYHLSLLERIDPTAVEPLLEEKLRDVLPLVRASSLKKIAQRRSFDLLDQVRPLVQGDSSPVARGAAENTLKALARVQDLTGDQSRLAALRRSTDPEDRQLAACAAGWMANGFEELTGLMVDRNRQVRRQAVVSAGRIGHPRFWPQIVGYLALPELADAAAHALILIGEPVLAELELAFNRADQNHEVKLRILNIYDRIGGNRVTVLLRDKLLDPNKAVRERVLGILSLLGGAENIEHKTTILHEIEEIVGAVVWNLSSLVDLGEGSEVVEVREALEGEIKQNRGSIFMLLSLIYDPKAIRLIRDNIESEVEEGTVYALEILEILIAPQLRPLVFPLLEDLPPAQVLKRLGRYFPEQHLNQIERLNAIIHRDYSRIGSWTKACAIQALGRLSTEVPDMLVANLFHPEGMLQELAARNIHQLSEVDFKSHVVKLAYEDRQRVERTTVQIDLATGSVTSVYDRVLLLARTRGFLGLSWTVLSDLAESAEDVQLEPETVVPAEEDPEGTLYVVVRGLLGPLEGMGPVISSKAVIAARPLIQPVQTLEPSHLLRLDGDVLLHLFSTHADLLPAILRASTMAPSGTLNSLSGFSTGQSTLLTFQGM